MATNFDEESLSSGNRVQPFSTPRQVHFVSIILQIKGFHQFLQGQCCHFNPCFCRIEPREVDHGKKDTSLSLGKRLGLEDLYSLDVSINRD